MLEEICPGREKEEEANVDTNKSENNIVGGVIDQNKKIKIKKNDGCSIFEMARLHDARAWSLNTDERREDCDELPRVFDPFDRKVLSG